MGLIHGVPVAAEKDSVDTLARVAERILDTARQRAGGDWTLLITHSGQAQMMADNDWPLDALLRERCGAMAFRVAHQRGVIIVDGRSLHDRCRLECLRPRAIPEHRAETPRLLPAPWG